MRAAAQRFFLLCRARRSRLLRHGVDLTQRRVSGRFESGRDTGFMGDEEREGRFWRIYRALVYWQIRHRRLYRLLLMLVLLVVVSIELAALIVGGTLAAKAGITPDAQGDAVLALVGVATGLGVGLYYLGKFFWWLRYH